MGQLPFSFRRQVRPAEAEPSPAEEAKSFEAPPVPGPQEKRREEIPVSRLLRDINDILATAPQVWVTGELSRWRPQASGTVYFSLKDQRSAVDCVLWRDHLRRLRFEPREGMEVACLVKPKLFERQGRFQLTVFALQPRGRGALHAQLEARIARLREEGLTAAERRRTLPSLPRCVGIVTSRDAAALQDVLRTTWRRDPQARVLLSPAPVQGSDAHHRLIRALRRLRDTECEVVLLVRGGGSLEDLWSFNEEALARAVAEHPVPVVTGVGHETDTTLVDLVADLRASTPTGAAEAAIPVRQELRVAWRKQEDRLGRSLSLHLDRARHRLERVEGRLRSPRAGLEQHRMSLDRLSAKLDQGIQTKLRSRRERLLAATSSLHPPDLGLGRRRLEELRVRLDHEAKKRPAHGRHRLALAIGRLEALSPLGVLARGYALVRGRDGQVLRRATEVQSGDELRVRLAEGELHARVTGRKKGSND
ncbi:MAG: exodeoxyribonuclease VII large subunit [Myxococcota bacterium]